MRWIFERKTGISPDWFLGVVLSFLGEIGEGDLENFKNVEFYSFDEFGNRTACFTISSDKLTITRLPNLIARNRSPRS